MKPLLPRIGLACALACLLSTVWRPGSAQSLNPLPKYLLTEKNVVILTAPQVVAGPTVLDAKWSPDGVRIAAIRRTQRFALDTPIEETHLVLWSASKQSHDVWGREMMLTAGPHLSWLTPEICTVELKWTELVRGTDANGQVVITPVPHQGILWVDSAHDRVTPIDEQPEDHLYISPGHPFAALLSPAQRQLILLKPDGSTLKRIPLPEKTTWRHYLPEDRWSADGLHVQLYAEVPLDDKPGQTLREYDLNIQTGELKFGQVTAPPAPKAAQTGLHLTQSGQHITYGRRTQFLRPLWLENTEGGKQSAVLLTSDASSGKISPLGSSALYLSEGTAFVTPWRAVPKEPFVSNIKAVVMSNAKQLGLGLIMYAEDYDESFPTPSDSLQNDLTPYLRNNDLYDGFNYTYGGGRLADITNPAQTELGTVDGPDGQAVIFADGHVRWFPRQ